MKVFFCSITSLSAPPTGKPILSLFILSLFIIIGSCSSNKHVNTEMLDKAYNIHQEAAQIEKEIQPKVAELTNLKNSINIQGRALTEEEISKVNQIEKLEASLAYWKENHPEIPGYEPGHVHGAGCSHGTEKQLELLPEDWVKVQQEFMDSIQVIQKRVDELMVDG